MRFGFTQDEKAIQEEAREFFRKEAKLIEAAEHEIGWSGMGRAGWGNHTWELVRKMGKKRWLAPTWPEKYGGMNATYMQRFIIHEETAYHGAPGGFVGAGMAGPVIMHRGSDEQKEEFLPKIARGEIEFALGYTEPQAGSDLASLEIRAEDKGDYYLMNGQKVFNTRCHYSQYHWLGARTGSGSGPKHKGISLFVVDFNTPGITIRPLWGMGGMRTNEVFYDNVQVPKSGRVGEENQGWYYIAEALDFERTFTVGGTRRIFEQLVDYLKQTTFGNKSLSENPPARQEIVELAIEIEIAALLAVRIPWMLDRGSIPSHEAAMLKMYATELRQHLANCGTRWLSLYGQLLPESKWATLRGGIAEIYLEGVCSTFVGGTSEIMRNIIALRGLGLPR